MYWPDSQPSGSQAVAQDRRRHARQTVQVQAELHEDGNDVPMRLATTDLSRAGCYVEVMMPLPVGANIQAVLWLDGAPAVIRGRVVTCHPQFGNGIMFVDYKGEAEQVLQRYIDGLVAATADPEHRPGALEPKAAREAKPAAPKRAAKPADQGSLF